MMPACLMPPPSALRSRCARFISSSDPASAEPTGAPSPLLKQIETVSNREAQSDATNRARDWLSQQIESLRAQVVQSDAAVEEYRSRAGLDHRRRGELRQVPQRRDVDLHRVAELFERLVLHANGLADTGVVDEDVDAPAPLDRFSDEPFAFVRVTDVGPDDDRTRQFRGESLEALDAPRRQHHLRAHGVQDTREVGAQPRRGTGDDGDTIVEPEGGKRIGGRRRGHGGHLGDVTREARDEPR